MFNILVIHGPNLNLLGIRELSIYGKICLNSVDEKLKGIAINNNAKLECYQSNSEGEIINIIHNAYNNKCDFIIINPAAFTHTSIAIMDSLLATNIPFIEVHISNIFSREKFRNNSYFSSIANGIICGFGVTGYEYALLYAIDVLNRKV